MAGSAGPALLLGPLAVDARHQKRGIGSALMRHAIAEARTRGHQAIILVGDEAYYRRFGFARAAVADLHLPGPVDRDRFLGLELVPGALHGAEGLVLASGLLAVERGAAAASFAARPWRAGRLGEAAGCLRAEVTAGAMKCAGGGRAGSSGAPAPLMAMRAVPSAVRLTEDGTSTVLPSAAARKDRK